MTTTPYHRLSDAWRAFLSLGMQNQVTLLQGGDDGMQ